MNGRKPDDDAGGNSEWLPCDDELAGLRPAREFLPDILSLDQNAELIKTAPRAQMNPLTVLKRACLDAMDVEEPSASDAGAYASIVDPMSVLAMIDMVEKRITEEEIQALHQLITEMGDYIRANAPSPAAEELLLRARQLVGLTKPH